MTDVSDHHLAVVDGRIRCAFCFASCNLSSKAARPFIMSPCTHASISGCTTLSRMHKKLVGPVQLNNNYTHISHNMFAYRGIVYCITCGYAAQKVLKGLADKCTGVKTTHGTRVVKALEAGSLPPGMTSWPDEEMMTNSIAPPSLNADEMEIVQNLQEFCNNHEAQSSSTWMETDVEVQENETVEPQIASRITNHSFDDSNDEWEIASQSSSD